MKELLFEHILDYTFPSEEIEIIRKDKTIYKGLFKNFNLENFEDILRLEIKNVTGGGYYTKKFFLTENQF